MSCFSFPFAQFPARVANRVDPREEVAEFHEFHAFAAAHANPANERRGRRHSWHLPPLSLHTDNYMASPRTTFTHTLQARLRTQGRELHAEGTGAYCCQGRGSLAAEYGLHASRHLPPTSKRRNPTRAQARGATPPAHTHTSSQHTGALGASNHTQELNPG